MYRVIHAFSYDGERWEIREDTTGIAELVMVSQDRHIAVVEVSADMLITAVESFIARLDAVA